MNVEHALRRVGWSPVPLPGEREQDRRFAEELPDLIALIDRGIEPDWVPSPAPTTPLRARIRRLLGGEQTPPVPRRSGRTSPEVARTIAWLGDPLFSGERRVDETDRAGLDRIVADAEMFVRTGRLPAGGPLLSRAFLDEQRDRVVAVARAAATAGAASAADDLQEAQRSVVRLGEHLLLLVGNSTRSATPTGDSRSPEETRSSSDPAGGVAAEPDDPPNAADPPDGSAAPDDLETAGKPPAPIVPIPPWSEAARPPGDDAEPPGRGREGRPQRSGGPVMGNEPPDHPGPGGGPAPRGPG